MKNTRMVRKERERLLSLWKEEHRREMEAIRKYEEENRWNNRLKRFLAFRWSIVQGNWKKHISGFETFISNLPLTIGAVALAIATLGVVWFKFAEENLDSCIPVHYQSAQCTFPEFPGCFQCDIENKWYRRAVMFHYGCSILAGACALSFILKVILAFRVVVDEMSSPTTSSPAGLLCMTSVCVFVGRGAIGQALVTFFAFVHLLIAIWFIYLALAYHILPDPSWYPNTVGIGLSAVKTWLYYPGPGIFLMTVS